MTHLCAQHLQIHLIQMFLKANICIQFKIAVLAFQVLHGLAPGYIGRSPALLTSQALCSARQFFPSNCQLLAAKLSRLYWYQNDLCLEVV